MHNRCCLLYCDSYRKYFIFKIFHVIISSKFEAIISKSDQHFSINVFIRRHNAVSGIKMAKFKAKFRERGTNCGSKFWDKPVSITY